MKLLLKVIKNKETILIDETNEDITIFEMDLNPGKRVVITYSPKTKVLFKKAELTLDQEYKKEDYILSNGYQSWSNTKEMHIDEIDKAPSSLIPVVEKFVKLTGDNRFYKYQYKKGIIHSVTYGYIRNNYDYLLYGSLLDFECFTFFEFNTKKKIVKVMEDIEGLVSDETITLFDFVILNGNKDEVFDRYFDYMNVKPITTKRVKGFTSWYNYYKNINEEIILKNLDNFKKFNDEGNKVDIFQIDDGYMHKVGDWLDIDKEKFPNGLQYVADKINESFSSGLWLAPFTVALNSKIAKEHPEYLIRNKRNKLVKSFSSCGVCYVLDIYNQDARNYIKNVFDVVFNDWHFKMVKLDFLYAECVISRNGKTKARIMRDAMEFLRECCNEHPILGCGLPLASGYGLVEYCRTGCDVSLDYGKGFKINKEAVSTFNDMIDSITRESIAKRAFLNDPDVFLLRSNNIKMTGDEKKILAVINAIFGDVLFTSDDFSLYPSIHTFDFLKFIWHLNDSKIIKYLIIDGNKVDVDILLDDKEYKYLINTSDKIWHYNEHNIEARNYKVIDIKEKK